MASAVGALALAGAATVVGVFGGAFAVQLALHRAAWRAARATRRCADETLPVGVARLRMVCRETALAVASVWRRPLRDRAPRRRPGAPSPATAGERRPIVLVHGYASSPASLAWLARRLRGDGWHVVAPRLGSWWRDLATAADRLGAALAAVREEPGAAEVTLIAHGLGGLVARVLLARAGRSGVRFVVTLGTPHGGTLACPWWRWGPFRRDVRPGSEALRALEATALPSRLVAMAISSPDDALVVPTDRAYWQEACNVTIDRSGHLDLASSERVYAVIAENLAPQPAAAVAGRGD